MGTGIVFVVVVAIWVVYFIQYWSRRREHLATARSVESFAEAMRVLERRPTGRDAVPGRLSSAYAMSPTRVATRSVPRPQVVAKPHSPAPTSRVSASQRGGATEMRKLPTAPVRRPADRRPAPMSPSRKVRGLALLASLAATLVTAGLAAFSVVAWWIPLIAVAAVTGSFLWLRSGVQGEIAARKAARRRVVRDPQRVAPAAAGAAAPVGSSDVTGADEIADWTAEPELVEATTVVAATDADAEQADGWSPVPVPPPTYTLKAKAQRPAPVDPEAVVDVPAEPATAEPSTDSGEFGEEQRAAYGT